MAKEENDDDTLESIETDAQHLRGLIEGMEFRRMFNNPMDPNNCFIDIQAGAGGTEAQDWASMLLRQYLRYCERKGFKVEILEQSDGDVAGIKTATLKVKATMHMASCAPKQAYIAWCASHHLTQIMAATLRFQACLFTRKSTIHLRSTSIRRMCVPILIAPPVPVVSTSIKRIPLFV
jgi:hypothetical protein